MVFYSEIYNFTFNKNFSLIAVLSSELKSSACLPQELAHSVPDCMHVTDILATVLPPLQRDKKMSTVNTSLSQT